MNKHVAIAVAKSLFFIGVGTAASVGFGFEEGVSWQHRLDYRDYANSSEQQKQAAEEPHVKPLVSVVGQFALPAYRARCFASFCGRDHEKNLTDPSLSTPHNTVAS